MFVFIYKELISHIRALMGLEEYDLETILSSEYVTDLEKDLSFASAHSCVLLLI